MTLANIIKSYAYLDFNDDPGVMAFVQAFNQLAQDYLDTVNDLNLPNYTADPIDGALLDWVAQGLYGFLRPVLPTTLVDDDTFRRVITWHYYKGDGMVFNIRWLKRRISRFLFGTNGLDPGTSTTYRISIVLGEDGAVNILIINNTLTLGEMAMPNSMGCNQFPLNFFTGTNSTLTPIPEADILQQAMQSGVLEMPFQFTFTVTQGGFIDLGHHPLMVQIPQPQLVW